MKLLAMSFLWCCFKFHYIIRNSLVTLLNLSLFVTNSTIHLFVTNDNTFHCTARCNTRRHTATHCNTPQQTAARLIFLVFKSLQSTQWLGLWRVVSIFVTNSTCHLFIKNVNTWWLVMGRLFRLFYFAKGCTLKGVRLKWHKWRTSNIYLQ